MVKSLLIDIGSTNIKYAVYKNHILSKIEKTPFPKNKDLPYPYFEVDLNLIMSKIDYIINMFNDLTDIFFSVQMHGYILGDINNKPLTSYISWQDKRSILVKYPSDVSKEYGTTLKDNLPKASVYAISKLEPNLYSQIKHFYTLGSYIAYYYTKENTTHISDAAPSGYYNVLTFQSDEMPFILPKVRKNVEVIGKYQGIRIHTPVGDQQAAIKGVNPKENAYILNSGTAAQLCTINDTFIIGDFESRPYFDEKTLCTVTKLMGAKAVRNYKGNNLVLDLYYNYKEALIKLPKREHLIIACGNSIQVKKLFDEIAKMLNINHSFYNEEAPINGLRLLAEEYYEKN